MRVLEHSQASLELVDLLDMGNLVAPGILSRGDILPVVVVAPQQMVLLRGAQVQEGQAELVVHLQ